MASVPRNVTGVAVQDNAIVGNALLGIDLNGDGVTPNDAGDGDSGPNGLQNFPEINTVTTNVPGPQFPLYAVGRRMLEAYPFVPILGSVRIGIAIFSYCGQLNFGLTGDWETVPDLHVLARGIEDGVIELCKAAAAATPQ